MQADRHRCPLELSAGDLVLLSTTNLKMPAYTRRKFVPRWLGPFVVEEAPGVSYRLKLPPTIKVHPVFHVSLLKRWHGPAPSTETPDIVAGEPEYEVDKILRKRVVKGTP